MNKKAILIMSPVLLVILITLVAAQSKLVFKPSPNLPKSVDLKPAEVKAKEEIPKPEVTPNLTVNSVKGIYSTAWIAGSQRMDQLIEFIKDTGVNSIVIDIKDDTGIISFPSEVALAREIGATSKRIGDIKALLTKLKAANIYTIARIVVFKDPLLAEKHPETAVKDRNGGLWRDRKGMIWVDPHNRSVWNYNLEVAKEAVKLGFSEVQFDYVRFLSDGKISNCVYPYSKGELKEDVIHDFLAYSKKELNAMGAPISADIFGLVLSVPDDLNIGQKLEKIASAVDYISPMIYPSHYPKGSLGLAEPDLNPYETVARAIQDALKRIPEAQAKLRPWLQDFSLANPYGQAQLAAQIKALQDNGINDWLFWNPSNRYDPAKYPLE